MQQVNILMLEDSPVDAELIQRELKRAGLPFTAHRVETEGAFRNALESTDYDVILGDYNLPRFDGISALKIAREVTPQIPFIFVSGSIGDERATQALREGATDYVLKDRLTRLPSAITRAIEERRERQLREATQRRLIDSEAALAEAQRIAQIGSWTFDASAGIEWSAETFRIFETSAEEFDATYEGYLRFVHPEDRDRVARLTSPPLLEESSDFQHRIICGNGVEKVVHCRLRVMEGTKERPSRLVGTIQDVTKRARAEETILRLSRQNRLILQYAAEGIVGSDSQGRAVFVNPAAERMTGFSAAELMTGSIHYLIHHTKADGSRYPIEECPNLNTLKDGRVRHGEELFWRKSGESFPVSYHVAPIYEEEGITGCVVTFEDITARKQLEARLEQANRVSSLGRVAATIAHEFNNVLMGIQPFAEIIRRRAGGDENLQRAADQIMTSVARGRRVTQEILRYTKPSPPLLQPVILCEWLAMLTSEFRGLVGNRVTLNMQLLPDRIEVLLDGLQMHQVLTNLVLNARDAMPEGGTITIAVSLPGDGPFPFGRVSPGFAAITVRDTGMGIPADLLQNIFEPLFTTKRTGTGLGLAVAQQVVALHGGSIHVESKIGEGTAFHILLPARIEAKSEEREPPHSARRVLLVEDDTGIATGVSLLLESEGFAVRVAVSGEEALPLVETFDPDVVILDATLPDMSGREVFERLAESDPSLPVIFSTGHSEMPNVPAGVDCLAKPYTFSELLQRLETLLHEARVAPAHHARDFGARV